MDSPNYQFPDGVARHPGDIGTVALGVRRDAGTPLVADGLYSPFLVDARGAFKVVSLPPGIPGTPDVGSHWQVSVAPAANTLATVTVAAPGANKRLVIETITATVVGSTGGMFRLFTVTSGGVIWQLRMGVAGVPAMFSDTLLGAVNTSAVFSYDAAPGSGNFETIAATGYVVSV